MGVSLRACPLDRPRAGLRLLHLEGAVIVDRLDVDLVERPIAEEGHQVAQRPSFVSGRLLGDLALARGGQAVGEGAERRHLIVLALPHPTSLLLRRRHPEPAAHVGEDVLQLLFGFAGAPALVLIAERQVLALAVGAEAQRVAAAALPLAHLDAGPSAPAFAATAAQGLGPRPRTREGTPARFRPPRRGAHESRSG